MPWSRAAARASLAGGGGAAVGAPGDARPGAFAPAIARDAVGWAGDGWAGFEWAWFEGALVDVAGTDGDAVGSVAPGGIAAIQPGNGRALPAPAAGVSVGRAGALRCTAQATSCSPGWSAESSSGNGSQSLGSLAMSRCRSADRGGAWSRGLPEWDFVGLAGAARRRHGRLARGRYPARA